jgi:hypothetical protein
MDRESDVAPVTLPNGIGVVSPRGPGNVGVLDRLDFDQVQGRTFK